jgi:molybdenum cofactor biosynthesis enzyme MoaA
LLSSDSLTSCSLVVWGGGEPTIGKDFEKIVNLIEEKIPNAQQRILTNSVKPSEIVKSILKKNRGQVVTSIDAGTDPTFEKIRGKNRLGDVCATLRDYSSINPRKVTIKYIFTDGNCSSEEVRKFVDMIASQTLLD